MSFRFDFALSFAGPSRTVARDLAGQLRALGFRVFFDEDYQHELIGVDGASYLRSIYSLESRFCVVLISAEYDKRTWTQLERESIQGRELRGETGILLPVLIDGHKPFWLPETRIYFDLSKRSTSELSALLYRKAVPTSQAFTPIAETTLECRKVLVRFLSSKNAFLVAPTGSFDDPPVIARLLQILGDEVSMVELPIKAHFSDIVCSGKNCFAIYSDRGGPPREVNFVDFRTGASLDYASELSGFDTSDVWKSTSHPTMPLGVLCSGYGRILMVSCEPVEQIAAFSVNTETYNPHACFLNNEQLCVLVDGRAVTYTILGERMETVELGDECLSAIPGPFANSLVVGLVNSIVCLDLSSGNIVWKREAPAALVNELVRNPSGSVLAAIAGFPLGANQLILLNGFDGSEIICPLPRPRIFQSCAFSAKGELLVAVEGGSRTSILHSFRLVGNTAGALRSSETS